MGQALSHPARRSRPAPSAWKDGATAALPVLACLLGGATEKWAEGMIVALLGLLLLVNPPRRSLGIFFNLSALGVLACAALAFLPAGWFFLPAWREALTNDFGIALPTTLSPQPWITAGCFGSLVAGLAWLYYASTQDLENRGLRRQLRIFALGVVLLAGLSIALYLAHTAPPFWHNQRGFGPFPNRNQTADLFGITAVILIACGQDDIRHGRRRWILWLVSLAVIVTAIVLNFSRAGIAILVAGSALWLGFLVLRRGSPARLAIGASALLVLLTAMLLFGGQTLERFHLRGAEAGDVSADFRWLIFRDTLELIRSSPWCGIGLGNFSPVFAIFRDASIGQNRALHPESDWLWICSEAGWPAVILILVGAFLLARRVFPLAPGTQVRLRMAAFIGGLLFALHGLVDVSGHRVGSSYAGLFLFALALHRPSTSARSGWLTTFFRALGLFLIALGATWTWSAWRALPLPGGIGADQQRQLAKATNAERNFEDVIMHASRGLNWAPLDWQLYFLRALGEVGAKRSPTEALDDFRRARFLEPSAYEVPYQEGLTWITRDPLLTMTAWREALRRAGPDRADLYGRMLSGATQLSPEVRLQLLNFGSVRPELALVLLGRATADDFNAILARLLEHDPALQTLSVAQREQLFDLWTERGDRARLAEFVGQDAQRLRLAWRAVAREDAARGESRAAIELAKQFTEPPKLPAAASAESSEQLQKKIFASPNDYESGFALYQRQMQEGKVDEALITVRRFTDQPAAPAYFHFLEAQAWAAQENWERAWTAWRKFDPKL